MDKSQISKIKKQVEPAVKKYLETNKKAIAKDILQNAKANNAKGLVKVKNNCLQWVARTVYRKDAGFDYNDPVDKTRAATVLTIFDMLGNDFLIPIIMGIAASSKIGELVSDLNVKIIANYVLKAEDVAHSGISAEAIAQNVLLLINGIIDNSRAGVDNRDTYNRYKGVIGAHLFAIGVVAAFNEESSKATANYFGFLKEYMIIFNVVEFTLYVIQIVNLNPGAMGFALKTRAVAVLAHIMFSMCHKLGVGWLGYILHATWNMLSIAIGAKVNTLIA